MGKLPRKLPLLPGRPFIYGFNRPHHGMLTCGPFVRLEVPMAALEFSVGIALSLGERAPQGRLMKSQGRLSQVTQVEPGPKEELVVTGC